MDTIVELVFISTNILDKETCNLDYIQQKAIKQNSVIMITTVQPLTRVYKKTPDGV